MLAVNRGEFLLQVLNSRFHAQVLVFFYLSYQQHQETVWVTTTFAQAIDFFCSPPHLNILCFSKLPKPLFFLLISMEAKSCHQTKGCGVLLTKIIINQFFFPYNPNTHSAYLLQAYKVWFCNLYLSIVLTVGIILPGPDQWCLEAVLWCKGLFYLIDPILSCCCYYCCYYCWWCWD